MSVEAPAAWSDLAAGIAASRWFMRGPDGRGETSVREMVRRVAGTLGQEALRSGHAGDDLERAALEDELTAHVTAQRATFATPVWLNLGLGERPITSACFIFSVADSIESLLEWNAREGRAFHHGAGAGANLSGVRGSAEPVSRGGVASGPVSFMRSADSWAGAIGAGGRARRGAKMVVLDADHPDVFEFVAVKAHEERRIRAAIAGGSSVEDARAAASFQNSNHSLRVTDDFMRTALAGGAWELHAVRDGAPVARVSARDLLRACAEAAWECGDPGLQFADTINSWNTCPHSGAINASNPCAEFMHIDDSACNLAALNLLAFVDATGTLDLPALTHAVDVLLLAQDVLVSCSGYPAPAVERNAGRFRQLGLGFTNLGALLLTLGIPYDSGEGRSLAASLTGLLTGAAYRRSAEMAAKLGPFAEFERNRESMLAVLERHRQALRDVPPSAAAGPVIDAALQAWDEAIELGREQGYRNAQVTLVAPTGTGSLTMDCDTTGIEPYYSFHTEKRLHEGIPLTLPARALDSGLRALGYPRATAAAIAAFAREHGSAGGAPGLRPEHLSVLATATGADGAGVSPRAQVAMVVAVQPLVSGGVSKTIAVPAETPAQEIEGLFAAAWSSGAKAISVYRQGTKPGQPLEVAD